MAGLLGHGDAFVLRDPSGIRPAFWYEDEEICVVASERPVIQTAFNLKIDQVKELLPGHALLIKKDGQVTESLINTPRVPKNVPLNEFIFQEDQMRQFTRKERLWVGLSCLRY